MLFLSVALLLIVNVIDIGADPGAVAEAAQLVLHILFTGLWFIMLTAATPHVHRVLNLTTPDQAAMVLRPFAGAHAFALPAFGIIGSGLLAIPVLAGLASYAI